MSNTDRTGRVMYGAVSVVLLLLVALASYTPAAILQAIVPASVPAASKQGSTGTKFLIANGAFTSGNLHSTDASGNAVDFGAGTLATVNGQALGFGGSINLPAGAQTPGGLFFSQGSTTTVTSSTFSSILGTGGGSKTLSAGVLNSVGAVLGIRAGGTMAPNVLGTLITAELSIGGTTCGSGSATLPASADSLAWNLEMRANTYTTGGTGTVFCNGQIVFVDTSVGTGTPVVVVGIDSGTTVTLNLTGTLAIDFFVSQGTHTGSFSTHNLYLAPF